ncbi:hypothetical protein GM708_05575 [Vibrio cholerae]|nr:hypothetical protein [Vibrio cholerae]
MRPSEHDVQDSLHDDAFRYAFRRSLSVQLSSAAALEAVEAVQASGTAPPPKEHASVLVAARSALERYLPPALPPRVEDSPALRSALSFLGPEDRELLLLHHWDGLSREDAVSLSGTDPHRLEQVEATCARALPAEHTGRLTQLLSVADPARAITEDHLAASRRKLPRAASDSRRGDTDARALLLGSEERSEHGDSRGGPGGRRVSRGRRGQAIVGTACLLAVVLALVLALVPRPAPGPAEESARLFDLADVVAVVVAGAIEPTLVDGEVRILRQVAVVQILKGGPEEDPLAVDVTGRSTLERPYSRNFFPPDQLMFLVRNEHGFLGPIEGDGSVLNLVDRRSPAATTIAGDPAPLPDEVRNSLDALPDGELTLDTTDDDAGSLDPESIVGIRPEEGRDAQNLPKNLLGAFHTAVEGTAACVWFDFRGRSVLLRWPKGFSAYQRESGPAYADGDPGMDDRILTVLNERGYPYVDENRPAPFISGAPTGETGVCGGRELEIWDIAVEPGSTLLFY